MSAQAQYPEKFSVMSEPQQALVSTISAGQEAIETAASLLSEKAKLPPLGTDPASVRYEEYSTCKETFLHWLSSIITLLNRFIPGGRRHSGTQTSRRCSRRCPR